MKSSVLLQALHRRDRSSIRLNRKKRARLDRLSVEQYRACATMTRVAPDVGAGELKSVADALDQKKPRLHFRFHRRSVDCDVNPSIRHGYLPLRARSSARRMTRPVSAWTR